MRYLLYSIVCTALTFGKNIPGSDFPNDNNLFAADVYQQLLAENENNILSSPFSAEIVVALTQAGARGATGEEIRSVLHLPDSEEETDELIGDVLPTIHSNYISVVTANKIYVENNLPIKDEFITKATQIYEADIENIEFGRSEEAAEKINQWVEEHTNNKIHQLINPDELDETVKFVLINALYFQGNWSQPFDPYFTQKSKFYKNAETIVDTIMMLQQSGEYNYFESSELDAQILELPFVGETATMTIVLPNEKEGILFLEKQLQTVFTTSFEYTKEFVQVKLPKFKIESTINFKNVLENLGVHKAFDILEADLSGIAGNQGDLFINQAKQKTYIDVNEGGVEAAAVTDMGGANVIPPPPTKFLTADHPFMFYIKVSDMILFEGRVSVPEYSE